MSCQPHACSTAIAPRRRIGPAINWLLLAVLAVSGFGQTVWETQFTMAKAGSCRLQGPGLESNVSSTQLSFEGTYRIPLPWPDWYFHLGLEADQHAFTTNQFGLSRLRGMATPLGVEYFQSGQPVAELGLSPGFYYQDRITLHALDMPVQAVSGIPLSKRWHGVVGVSNARFTHHAIPIIGLVWEVDSQWRCDLIYPEPAIVHAGKNGEEWRFGGRLNGGGYLANTSTSSMRVEYSSYRLGLTWASTVNGAGWKTSLSIGVELMRDLDFFERNRRLHGSGAYYLEIQLDWNNREIRRT